MVAVTDAQVAEAAAAHDASHGGIADEAYHGNRQTGQNTRASFRKQNLADDLQIRGPHSLSGLYQSLVDFTQACFNNAGNERSHRDREWNDGCRSTD